MNFSPDDQELVELMASLAINEANEEKDVPLMVHLDHHVMYDQLRMRRIVERMEQEGIMLVDIEVDESPVVFELKCPDPMEDIILEDPKGNQPYYRRFEKGRFKGGR